jgi:hypothetical protein
MIQNGQRGAEDGALVTQSLSKLEDPLPVPAPGCDYQHKDNQYQSW